MIEIKGKYNTAIVYQTEIDDTTRNQLQILVDQPFVENENIRVMPDCHAGTGCVIGFTQTINNGKVCPNLVGVDIGCGIYIVALEGIKKEDIDFDAFDRYLRTHIPSGRNIRESSIVKFPDILKLKCYRELKDAGKFEKALGTLGGGNHFIEIDEDSWHRTWLVVHTGSRNMGKQVADYYQNLADGICNKGLDAYFIEKNELIKTYKEQGRKSEIQKALIELKKKYEESTEKVPKDLAYLEGDHLNDYLHDMDICQRYAILNRETILRTLCKFFDIDFDSIPGQYDNTINFKKFDTVHNYIDLEQKILRKGSIDCSLAKMVMIPMNMKDGSVIAQGKGNPEYNYSGPHGAGRLMSRAEAKRTISLEDFKKDMEGIYTTSVCEDTIDESSFAYKNMYSILPWIEDTCQVLDIIKPIYNFKASE